MKKFFSDVYQRIYLYLYRDVIALSDTRHALLVQKQSQDELSKTIASMESTIATQQKVLVDLASNVRYLAASERAHLQRAGQPHEF